MAYEKTNWQTGDVITAEKLNKMEQGIADAMQLVDLTEAQPFADGDVKYSADYSPGKAYPVPAAYLEPNVIFIIKDPYDENSTVVSAMNRIAVVTITADEVDSSAYVLPVGSTIKLDGNFGVIYYDETLTPIQGQATV